MKKLLSISLIASTALLFNGCDELGVEKEDVFRWDTEVSVEAGHLVVTDEVVKPFEYPELERYEEQRENLLEFTITDITVRFYNLVGDDPANRMTGQVDLVMPNGNQYHCQPYEVGNEYQDWQEHSAYKMSSDNSDDRVTVLNNFAQDIVDYDSFTVKTGDAEFGPGDLEGDCSLYFYIEYKGR